jgi:beta-glucanase (GH16 family)
MSRSLLFWVIAIISILNVSANGGYRLVWSDEFDGSSLNKDNWEVMTGDGTAYGLPSGWGNQETQYYTGRAENVKVEGGNLVITALKGSYEGCDFTSGRLRTKGRHEFLFGKIEARIKFPKSQGMWPAFWMMPTVESYGGWACSGEIDIVETINKADHVYGTIHYGGIPPDNVYSTGRYVEKGVNFAEGFHIYTLEWQPYQMRWYVDGKVYLEQNEWFTMTAAFPSPFDKPFYILFNLAVGGRHSGPVNQTTTWPACMYVDWVRVYQTDNKPPQVTIAAPVNNANIPADTDIVIEAKVIDPDGDVNKVEFYDDYELIAVDYNEPYSIKWAAPDGCYKIKVKALDKDGLSNVAIVNVTKGAGCPQQPFYGTPFVIPGKIEAEDFDAGPVNVSYWDTDVIDNGRSGYRKNTGVDISYREGKYILRDVRDKEWLEYTIDVTRAGAYDIKSCVTGSFWRQIAPSKFHIEIDGIKIASLDVPKADDKNSNGWIDITAKNIRLPAGKHVMRFFIESGGFSLDYFEIVPSSPEPNTETKPASH